MTHEQIALVRRSFAAVRCNSDLIAMRFYARLFVLDSSLRSMFPSDMNELRPQIVAMLAFVVKELGKPEGVFPHIVKLGARHYSRAVDDRQYATVGEALLWALEKELGSDFTPEVREAWKAVYTVFARMIIAVSQKSAMAA